MHGWLWADRRDPDTQLVLTQPDASALVDRNADVDGEAAAAVSLVREGSSRLVGRKRKAEESPAHGTPPASEPASASAPSHPAGSVVHEVHWIILSGASEYFKRRLTTSLGTSESSGTSGSPPAFKHVFSEQVEEGQLEAAAAVLQAMYTQELTTWTGNPGHYTDHLLRMLQIADRWQSPTCMDLVSKALQLTDPKLLTTAQLESIYSQPAGLQSSTIFAPILEIARQGMLSTYGDAPTVVQNPSLHSKLSRLPLVALLALLNSVELTTDSENSVLIIVLQWLLDRPLLVPATVESDSGDHEVISLLGAVRCSHLSNYLLPLLISEAGQYWSRLGLHVANLAQFQGLCLDKHFANTTFADGLLPPDWVKPPRPQASVPQLPIQLDMLLSKDCLLAALETMARPYNADVVRSVTPVTTHAVYSHGYFWKLRLDFVQDLPTQPTQMYLCPVLTCSCAISTYKTGFTGGSLTITLARADHTHGPTSSWRDLLVRSNGLRLDLFRKALPLPQDFLDPAKWEQFLVDGSVRVKLKILKTW